MEEGALSQGMRALLEAGKVKEVESPREPPERIGRAHTRILGLLPSRTLRQGVLFHPLKLWLQATGN